jgi:hypothetical protein
VLKLKTRHKRGSALQIVDLHLDILEEAEQNHVLDAGTHQRHGEPFVHAGPSYRYGSLTDFLRLSEKDALSAGFASIERVGL